MQWARYVKAPLTANEVHVLVELADFARDDGTHCFPEMGTLARRCRLSRATVYRILDRLEHQHHVIRKVKSGASSV
jgi:DNA-binding MarR family transcriptional regulator